MIDRLVKEAQNTKGWHFGSTSKLKMLICLFGTAQTKQKTKGGFSYVV